MHEIRQKVGGGCFHGTIAYPVHEVKTEIQLVRNKTMFNTNSLAVCVTFPPTWSRYSMADSLYSMLGLN